MTKYSNSRLSTFSQCKKKYKFKYIDREEKDFENTVEAFMGDIVHRALEKIYKDLKYEKVNTLKEIEQWYHDTWEEEWSEDILIVKSEYSEKNYKKKGLSMLRQYYEEYAPFTQQKTIGLETYYLYDLDEENSYHIRIDRLSLTDDGVYQIRDFKTANNLPPRKKFEEDTQLATYALGVKEMYPDAEEIELIWHYLAFNKEIKIKVTDEMLERVEKDLLQRIETVESTTKHPPTKSPLCDYCAYKSRCPLWKHLFSTDDDAESIKKKAEKYIQLKQEQKKKQKKLDKLKKELGQYMEENDVQRIFADNDKNVYRWSKDTIKLPRKGEPGHKELVKALKALNLYEEYEEINVWKLQKDTENLPPIQKNVLKKIGEENKIERYYVHDS